MAASSDVPGPPELERSKTAVDEAHGVFRLLAGPQSKTVPIRKAASHLKVTDEKFLRRTFARWDGDVDGQLEEEEFVEAYVHLRASESLKDGLKALARTLARGTRPGSAHATRRAATREKQAGAGAGAGGAAARPAGLKADAGSAAPAAPDVPTLVRGLLAYMGKHTDELRVSPAFKLHLEDHREQFATLLQVCGPLFHVQVVDPGPPATVDAYCGDMTQVVRLRVHELDVRFGSIWAFARLEPRQVQFDRLPANVKKELEKASDAASTGPFGLRRGAPVPARLRVTLKAGTAGKDAPRPRDLVVVLPRLDADMRYSEHSASVNGGAVALSASGSLLFGEVKGGTTDICVEHRFCHHAVEVARGLPQPPRPEPEPSPAKEDAALLKAALEADGLLRRAEEEDALYLERLLRALRGVSYDVNARGCVWKTKRGGCEEMSRGLCDALRLAGIPARLSLGLKVGSAMKAAIGVAVAPHCMAVVFLEALGWVPVDATSQQLGHAAGVLSFVALGAAPAAAADVATCEKKLPGWAPAPGPINEGLGRLGLVGLLVFEREKGGGVRELPVIQRDFDKVSRLVGDKDDVMEKLPPGTMFADVEYFEG